MDRFGQTVGEIDRVLLLEDGGFDGIIDGTATGRRFVDAPEVRRISLRAVTLGITAADVESPGAPRLATAASTQPRPTATRLSTV